MIAGTGLLTALSLVVSVAINPGTLGPELDASPTRMSDGEKAAMMRPLVKSATECVAKAVAKDPRLGEMQFTEIIVESFASCAEPVRALIDAHDQCYGVGTGERFFMGPYLDVLPAAVRGMVGYQPR